VRREGGRAVFRHGHPLAGEIPCRLRASGGRGLSPVDDAEVRRFLEPEALVSRRRGRQGGGLDQAGISRAVMR
jgi:hypothetical protein